MSNEAMTAEPLEMISFRIADNDYALDIRGIQEIRGWTPTTPLPLAPDYMLGVVNLRGKVVPVMDLATLLGFAPTEPSDRHALVMANLGENTVGLLVEAVSDILTVTPGSMQPTPDLAGKESSAFVVGILTIEGRMISLLSLDRLSREDLAVAA